MPRSRPQPRYPNRNRQPCQSSYESRPQPENQDQPGPNASAHPESPHDPTSNAPSQPAPHSEHESAPSPAPQPAEHYPNSPHPRDHQSQPEQTRPCARSESHPAIACPQTSEPDGSPQHEPGHHQPSTHPQ